MGLVDQDVVLEGGKDGRHDKNRGALFVVPSVSKILTAPSIGAGAIEGRYSLSQFPRFVLV